MKNFELVSTHVDRANRFSEKECQFLLIQYKLFYRKWDISLFVPKLEMSSRYSLQVCWLKPTRIPYLSVECILEKWNILVKKNKNICIFDYLSFDFHAMEKSNEHQVKADPIANIMYTFQVPLPQGQLFVDLGVSIGDGQWVSTNIILVIPVNCCLMDVQNRIVNVIS